MKIYLLVIPVVSLGAFALIHTASALTISVKGNNPGQVKAKCNDRGGHYFGPGGGPGSTWGCVFDNGHGEVCGGAGAHNASTCDTFIAWPHRNKLPTREEAQALGAKTENK